MTEYVLTAIDTTRIQGYVFGSNKLMENIGGSELVEMATRGWVYEALPAANNVVDTRTGTLDIGRTIDSLDAELIYAGGGNTVILFKTLELARQFTSRLTRRVLKEAPGLELVVAHRRFDWNKDALAEVVSMTLAVDLARKKQNRVPSMPLLGLGVTVPCNSTGLVASEFLNDEPVSQGIGAKRNPLVQTRGQSRLKEKMPRVEAGRWEIPNDLDQLGRHKGEESYIAVVHADGNGMGKRVEAITARYNTPARNRDYIDGIRGFSRALEDAATKALASVVDLMADAFSADPELANHHRNRFPLRPIVFGGDDVTFVCHGSYGLSLAIRYLEAFEEATREEPAFNGSAAYACAGIAIVKTHYPFARAYRLSEQLCRSAKQMLKENRVEGSALDWHVAISGITGSLEEIRQREYVVQQGKLNMRPVLLRQPASIWRTWPVFETILHEFVDEDGGWYSRRNKVKALREALRGGPDAINDFLHTYQLDTLPSIGLSIIKGYQQSGWADGCCVYFDAIEMMDLFTDLHKHEVVHAETDQEIEHATL